MPTLQELLEMSIGFVDRTKHLNLLDQKNLTMLLPIPLTAVKLEFEFVLVAVVQQHQCDGVTDAELKIGLLVFALLPVLLPALRGIAW